MRVRHFEDTDTLYIELRSVEAAESRDIDDHTLIEVDDQGRMVGITIEHARQRAELSHFACERIEA